MGLVSAIRSTAAGRRAQVPTKEPVPVPTTVPESRRGKRGMTVWFDPVIIQRIKALALETGRSQQDLALEAYDFLFEKHGKPPIGRGDGP